jgi:hypothetical protein
LKAGFWFLCVQGFVMNLQPSEAEAGFDIRVPTLDDVDDLQRRIDKDWAPASRNFTYSVITANLKPVWLKLFLCRGREFTLLVFSRDADVCKLMHLGGYVHSLSL